MTSAQVEVITSVQRRRRWSLEAKRRIVAAAIEPGAVVSEVAREAGSMSVNCSDGVSSSVVRPARHRCFRRLGLWRMRRRRA
jgi:hypothetical protein